MLHRTVAPFAIKKSTDKIEFYYFSSFLFREIPGLELCCIFYAFSNMVLKKLAILQRGVIPFKVR
jgi:hypothetical protein